MKPSISICIPTYNRELYLKRLLESIVHQKGFTNEVEIVINDGPSVDNTQVLVKEYQDKYTNIRYFRNPKAIGMMPAILEAISLSNGTYTWLFGSDDVMLPQSLEYTLSVIKNTKADIILSDRKVFMTNDQIIPSGEDGLIFSEFDGFEEFSTYLGDETDGTPGEKANYFTYMSIFCFNTDLYLGQLRGLKHNNDFERLGLQYHYFNYVLILFSNITKSNKIVIIRNNIVFTQDDNCSWTGNKKIIQDLEILFNFLLKKYNLDAGCEVFFKKVINGWSLAINYLQFLLNSPVMRFLKRNKYSRGFYKSCSRIFSYFQNMLS